MAIKRKYWFAGIVGATVLCGVGGYTGFGIPQNGYHQELARAEAIGLPSEPEAYQREVDSHDNAAVEYAEAIAAWKQIEESAPEKADRLSSNFTTDVPLGVVAKDLTSIEGLFRKLDAAAAKPDLCFGHQYSEGWNAAFPEVGSMSVFAKLRFLRTRVYASQGNFDAAYAELERGAAISRQLGKDNPTLFGLMIQVRTRDLILRGLEELLCQQGRRSGAAVQCEAVVAALGPLPDIRNALRGQYASALGIFALLEDPKRRAEFISLGYQDLPEDEPHAARPGELLFGIPAFRYQMMAQIVRYYRTAYMSTPIQPDAFPEHISAQKALSRQFDHLLEAEQQPMNFLFNALWPVMSSSAVAAVGKSLAQERLIKLLAFNFSRPGAVQIPADFPADPFSGKPLLVKSTRDGFRLWSIGCNAVDDGGSVSSSGDMAGDIVVGYPYVHKYKRLRWRSGAFGARSAPGMPDPD